MSAVDEVEGDEAAVDLGQNDDRSGAIAQLPTGGPNAGETDRARNEALALLYEEAKRTIAEWCRDADRSARQLIADAEATRRQAHQEANRIREQAQLDAGQIKAAAEAEAGRLRAEGQLSGAGRRAEIEELRDRVQAMEAAVDQLLLALEGVMASVAGFARPAAPASAAAALPAREATEGEIDPGSVAQA